MMKQRNCERCEIPLPIQTRGYPRKYCKECKKTVRVEDTQRYMEKKDDQALGSIDPKYFERNYT